MADSVVSDALGRAAIDRVLEGVATTQAQAGILPGGKQAEEWARGVVDSTVRRHEEREARRGIDTLKGLQSPDDIEQTPVGESPSKLDRGEIPDDAQVINRSLDPSSSLVAAKHLNAAPPMSLEDQFMMIRVNVLSQFPDWRRELEQAWEAGEKECMTSGSDLDRTDALRRHRSGARRVFEVLDRSNAFFGDWRNPPRIGNKVIVPVLRAHQVPTKADANVIVTG